MIREADIVEAIAEMQGQKNPNAQTCIKLAAYYTILDHITDKPVTDDKPMSFSGAMPERDYDGDSEFAQLVRERDWYDVMSVMDELMSTLEVVHPRLYKGVINKLIYKDAV